MKVYLAGKIARNDWRHDLVPGLSHVYSQQNFSDFDYGWQSMPMYRNDFEYVGPYFIGCDHGCGHGDGNHGAGILESGCIDLPFRPHMQAYGMQEVVAARCRAAINDCDVFFAWLENPCTAYGTLVELGMASALGKPIIVGLEGDDASDDSYTDLWFALEHAEYLAGGTSAGSVFREWADHRHPFDEQRDKCESPLEILFWDAYQLIKRTVHEDIRKASSRDRDQVNRSVPTNLAGLVAQHPVTVDGRMYRLDFAIPERKIAFEMDGYTYHGKDREHFNRDRRRDTALKLSGWEVHRFDGDLIRDNAHHVVELAAKLAEGQ